MSRILDRVLVIAAIVLSSIAIVNFISNRRPPPSSRSGVQELRGTTLPPFTIRLMDTTLGSMTLPVSDEPTLLYLMSTTCAACSRNEARWDALRDSVRGIARVVAVSVEGTAVLQDYWSIRQPDYPVGMLAIEGQDSIIRAYRMHATPTLYLLDSAGILRDTWVGVLADSVNHRIVAAVRTLHR
jgi:hypothetical protein